MRYLPILLLLFCSQGIAGTTYYVKPGGNNNANGLSHATAWETTGKVNSYNFQTGDDVYFESNGEWPLTASDGPIIVDWSGTAQDRVIIGSYYWNGSTEVIGISGTRPTIYGNFEGINDITLVDTANGIPPNRFLALISIGTDSVAQSYVTIQDFRAVNSAGRGMRCWNNAGQYNTFDNNVVQHTASAGIATRCEFTTIKNNEAFQIDPKTLYGGGFTDGQPCLYSNFDNNIFENNYAHECWYEGIGVYKTDGNNIVRNNVLSTVRRSGIYFSDSSNNVAENNIIIGDKTIHTIGVPATNIQYVFASGWPGNGLNSTDEGFRAGNTVNNYFRNNLVANFGRCFKTACNADCFASGESASGFYYGNICAGANENASTTGFSGREITAKNNIFIYSAAEGTTADCNWSAAESTFDGNYWMTQPVDVDCRGANDVYTGLDLIKTEGWFTVDLNNQPVANDFKPANRTVSRAVDTLTTVVFNSANYPDELLSPGCTFDLTESSQDYDCLSRETITDIGAFHENLTDIVIYDEAVSGDLLSFLPINQQINVGSLGVGVSTVSGNVAISDGYRDSADSFNLTIPAGLQISSAQFYWQNMTAYNNVELVLTKINNIDTPTVFFSQQDQVDFNGDGVFSPWPIWNSVFPATEATYNVRIPNIYSSQEADKNLDWTVEFTVTAQ